MASEGNEVTTVRAWTFGEMSLVVNRGGRLDRLCGELHQEFPCLLMQFKTGHWYWRALGWIVLLVTFGGNKEFVKSYTTTFRRTIGWSSTYEERIEKRTPDWEDRVWSCLMHEREHLRQFERWGMLLMTLSYVFVFFPVGLAWCRAYFERAGYYQTMRCWYLLDPSWARSQAAKDWWVSQFTTGAYGWMWPFKKAVSAWYTTELSRIEAAAA